MNMKLVILVENSFWFIGNQKLLYKNPKLLLSKSETTKFNDIFEINFYIFGIL